MITIIRYYAVATEPLRQRQRWQQRQQSQEPRSNQFGTHGNYNQTTMNFN